MKITSPAFENNKNIPDKYTCKGEGTNPPLVFSGVPEETMSLVLIMDDPDAPMGTFVHWVLYNINPKTLGIGENSKPQNASSGITSRRDSNYVPPCPPSGTHRYFFKLYALKDSPVFIKAPTKEELESAIKPNIIEDAELIGLYSKK